MRIIIIAVLFLTLCSAASANSTGRHHRHHDRGAYTSAGVATATIRLPPCVPFSVPGQFVICKLN